MNQKNALLDRLQAEVCGVECRCGHRKLRGQPFCRVCWFLLGPVTRSRLEANNIGGVIKEGFIAARGEAILQLNKKG
ncbi:hypothetical protein [Crateriforma conspicua]|uniref:Uncharacterized protein n=1 Tax=Crateriforma conspicua TaxID=2527996 RepID=A0A5C6FVT7_9PLAN|nr:hypothetical protein [Crateriforma conspicua]TWU66474.1 hypothetical protein V7x_20400 [Crateriforma conspicua]